MVSAPIMIKERGVKVSEVTRDKSGIYDGYIKLTVITERQQRSVAGTVFSDGKPRIIQVKGINMAAELAPHMLYVTNQDKPGFIGRFGQVMGEADVNIATLNLGRDRPGGDAICLTAGDAHVSDEVLNSVKALPMVMTAHRLEF